jgi:hypothetical protein
MLGIDALDKHLTIVLCLIYMYRCELGKVTQGENRYTHRFLVGKYEGERSLGKNWE